MCLVTSRFTFGWVANDTFFWGVTNSFFVLFFLLHTDLNVIYYTCAFPALTIQNVCHERTLESTDRVMWSVHRSNKFNTHSQIAWVIHAAKEINTFPLTYLSVCLSVCLSILPTVYLQTGYMGAVSQDCILVHLSPGNWVWSTPLPWQYVWWMILIQQLSEICHHYSGTTAFWWDMKSSPFCVTAHLVLLQVLWVGMMESCCDRWSVSKRK